MANMAKNYSINVKQNHRHARRHWAAKKRNADKTQLPAVQYGQNWQAPRPPKRNKKGKQPRKVHNKNCNVCQKQSCHGSCSRAAGPAICQYPTTSGAFELAKAVSWPQDLLQLFRCSDFQVAWQPGCLAICHLTSCAGLWALLHLRPCSAHNS